MLVLDIVTLVSLVLFGFAFLASCFTKEKTSEAWTSVAILAFAVLIACAFAGHETAYHSNGSNPPTVPRW